MNRSHFSPPFRIEAVPAWICTSCNNGVLVIDKKSVKDAESANSKKNREHEDWEPDWISERFSARLNCSHCADPVFMVGIYEPMYDEHPEFGSVSVDGLRPHFMLPAPSIIQAPTGCPDDVVHAISEASSLFWSSPPSAANKIRIAVERLLDHLKISKGSVGANGRFNRLGLHARIELYKKKKPAVGKILLAIKVLGNEGSHSGEIEASDILDAFELFADALAKIYDKNPAHLRKITTTIIKEDGPLSKRKKK